jgi:hypothetical protein
MPSGAFCAKDSEALKKQSIKHSFLETLLMAQPPAVVVKTSLDSRRAMLLERLHKWDRISLMAGEIRRCHVLTAGR